MALGSAGGLSTDIKSHIPGTRENKAVNLRDGGAGRHGKHRKNTTVVGSSHTGGRRSFFWRLASHIPGTRAYRATHPRRGAAVI